MDFTDVDYQWGDAPVACFMPSVLKGIQHVGTGRLGRALPWRVLWSTNLPWFSLDESGIGLPSRDVAATPQWCGSGAASRPNDLQQRPEARRRCRARANARRNDNGPDA